MSSILQPNREFLATVRSVAELRRNVAAWRAGGATVGLVPTMGAIHDGHLALVRRAARECDRVVASLFVNPTQFGPNEDFEGYPRDEARDAALLAEAGTDLLFAPAVSEMYGDGAATTVTVAGITEPLCGAFRPGHFAGVATVVAKLLNQSQPDRAYFGEKDYQQLQVIRRLVRDLALPVEVVGVETVREEDGLALSSRNAYLSAEERAIAPVMYRTLSEVARNLRAGADARGEIECATETLRAAGFRAVDYVDVRDAETLEFIERATGPTRVFAAAWLGRARLIDNVPVA